MNTKNAQGARLFTLVWMSLLTLSSFGAIDLQKSILHTGAPLQSHVENEFVMAVTTQEKMISLEQVREKFPMASELLLSRQLEDGSFETLILVDTQKAEMSVESLSIQESTKWIQPNFSFEGDPREVMEKFEIPFTGINDPRFLDQVHHKLMESEKAWEENRGSNEVIVAVTDDGVDLDHEDLASNIWTNQNEIPNNKIDDDQNGYVDDTQGWDFCDKDSDANPNNGGSHGTHVAGIIAAQQNNALGVTGVAPNVKIMPLRWAGSGWGSGCRWTAAVIAKTYSYAVDNGAKIINTSYNIDGFANNPVYLAAINYVYEKGGIIFNSAGNAGRENPTRVKNDQYLLVASTDIKGTAADARSSFSNYGIRIDIASPGRDILSTIPSSSYSNMSGTSMASPNAAAVAALIWSKNPSWTRAQVVAKLYQAIDNIDKKNPKYVTKLGPGRVNAKLAVDSDVEAPRILGLAETKNGLVTEGVEKLTLLVKDHFDAESIFKAGAFKLERKGFFFRKKVVQIELTNKVYQIGTNVLEFNVPGGLKAGSYVFTASSGVLENPFGQALDGDADGKAGGDFVVNFKTVTSTRLKRMNRRLRNRLAKK